MELGNDGSAFGDCCLQHPPRSYGQRLIYNKKLCNPSSSNNNAAKICCIGLGMCKELQAKAKNEAVHTLHESEDYTSVDKGPSKENFLLRN